MLRSKQLTCKALVSRKLLLFKVDNSISHFLAFAELKYCGDKKKKEKHEESGCFDNQ